MSFLRYPEYKDSGVEWLGEVPGHWEARPIKALALLKGGAGFPDAEQGLENEELPFYKVASLGQADARGILQSPPDSISRDTAIRLGAFVFPAGSLTFAKVGAALLLARVRQIPEPSCLDNNMMGMLITEANDARFVLFAMSLVRFDLISNPGAVPSLNAGQIGSFQLAVPPRAEQTAIATFLDHETAKIDALVAEQEKLIALLQEKRQAVISHAVTKGLDPTAPMKRSGVEWLGEVPGHWLVGKCGFYLSILSGYAFPSSGFTEDDNSTKLLRGANVGVARLKWDDTVYWRRLEGDGLDVYELRAGDLVIGMDRPLISEGMRVAIVEASDLPCLLLQRVASLKTGKKLATDYLFHLLSSEMFVAHFSPETTGVSVPHISPDQINNFVIPVPPIQEQHAICDAIRKACEEFDVLIAEAQSAITLLQERRTALISAAVTGQIDVRGWVGAASAPDSIAASAYPASA